MAFDWLTQFHHDLEKEPDYNEKAVAAYRLGMRGKGSIAGIKIEPGANCCEAARNLPEGTIYPALHRLEQAGLLASRWVTADSGRRRRVYALTRRGIRALDQQRATWEQFSDAIGGLLGGTRPSKNPA